MCKRTTHTHCRVSKEKKPNRAILEALSLHTHSHRSQTPHILRDFFSCLLLVRGSQLHRWSYPDVCNTHTQTSCISKTCAKQKTGAQLTLAFALLVWREHDRRKRFTATLNCYYRHREVFVLVKQHQACDSLRSSEDRSCSSCGTAAAPHLNAWQNAAEHDAFEQNAARDSQ